MSQQNRYMPKKDDPNTDYKQPVFADSAYKSAAIEPELRRRGFDPQIIACLS
jgi:hypothetical protein